MRTGFWLALCSTILTVSCSGADGDAPASKENLFVYPGHKLNLDGYFKSMDLTSVGLQKCEGVYIKPKEPRTEQKMLGKPVPSLEWDLIGGGKLNVTLLKDKKIVVLGVMALGCPDCVLQLPYLADIADAYKDKDVVVYFVSLRDGGFGTTREGLAKFMEKQDFSKIPLAVGPSILGPNGYQALDRPTTYIVGKDGIVKAVHLNRDSTLVPTIKQELDLLLAGKELSEANAIAPKK